MHKKSVSQTAADLSFAELLLKSSVENMVINILLTPYLVLVKYGMSVMPKTLLDKILRLKFSRISQM